MKTPTDWDTFTIHKQHCITIYIILFNFSLGANFRTYAFVNKSIQLGVKKLLICNYSTITKYASSLGHTYINAIFLRVLEYSLNAKADKLSNEMP